MAKARVTKKVQQALHELPDEFLECRDFGHVPRHIAHWATVLRRNGMAREICRFARCVRCGTERYTYYEYPTMVRISSTYRYPSGYTLKNMGFTTDERLPRAAVLIESMRRSGPLLDGPPEDEFDMALNQLKGA